MEKEQFYAFGSKLVLSTIQAYAFGLNDTADENDDTRKLMRGDYSGISFPVQFKQEYGKKLRDILDTGDGSFHLISDNLKQILEENKFTGRKAFPVKIYDKKGKEITGYHGLSVTGKSNGPIYKRSEIIEKRLVAHGPICRYYKGMHIDGWDGSDFFTPDTTTYIIITKQVTEILKKNKITNVHLRSLDEIEISVRYTKNSTILLR